MLKRYLTFILLFSFTSCAVYMPKKGRAKAVSMFNEQGLNEAKTSTMPDQKPLIKKDSRRTYSDNFQVCAERFASLNFNSEAILNICKEAHRRVE